MSRRVGVLPQPAVQRTVPRRIRAVKAWVVANASDQNRRLLSFDTGNHEKNLLVCGVAAVQRTAPNESPGRKARVGVHANKMIKGPSARTAHAQSHNGLGCCREGCRVGVME